MVARAQRLEVLCAEPVMERFTDVLTRDGDTPHHWTFAYSGDPRMLEAARTADVLVCSSATADLVGAAPGLRLLHVTGAGYDKIPLDALDDEVTVANTYHHGPSIAEHVLMVSMMLMRGVLRSEREVRAGRWRNAVVDPGRPFGRTLAGRTLGLVGFGEIGGEVARLAAAVGMRVRAVRRSPDTPLPPDVTVEWVGGQPQLHELMAASDVVVVTVPLSERTHGLIDAAALAAMRPDGILVNVARGPVVDEAALHAALSQRRIGGAGIDVWWRNPRGADSPPPSHLDFTTMDNVVLTPHQSGHTDETFRGRARDIADNIDALATGCPLRNVVRGPRG